MGLRKAIQNFDPVQATYVQTSAAGTAPDAFVFVNPTTSGEEYEIIQVSYIYDVAGGASAAADIKVVPSGTALASGTSAMATVPDLTATARTPRVGALSATASARLVPPGSSVAVDTSGTLTGLAGLAVTIYMRPRRGAKRL